MPWGSEDAPRHTKKARSGKAKRQWREVANSVLRRTGSEGAAVRAANGVIRKRGRKKKSRSGKR